jgi:ribose transport system ATP-binding protein
VVLISSDLEELVEGADRVVMLRAGAVVGELVGDEISEEGILAALAAHEDATTGQPTGAGAAASDGPESARNQEMTR